MNAIDSDLLHRLLDEAFAPYPVTPESLDLKQEVRANLTARAAELQAGGATATDAARTALAELGDVGALLGDETPSAGTSWAEQERRHRVRPKPAFAVRTGILAGLLALDLVLLVLQFAGILAPDELWIIGQIVAAALIVGWLVADALRQETTAHYPVPRARAIGFGAASTLMLLGVGILFPISWGVNTAWLVIMGLFVVLAIGLFTFLGVTATNRAKPWVVRAQAGAAVPDRFEKDPAAAARFGIYTVVLWVVALIVFVVLTVTVGWAWSWLALVGGFLAMMLLLARMLFGHVASNGDAS